MTLEITAEHVERITSHSKESHPIEACGVLIGTFGGDVRTVTEIWPAKNRLSSESSYEIDPETLFRAFSHAEKNNLEIVGFYHSHPFSSADASEIDRARANYPGFSYVIYSIPRNEILSFHFDGKRLAKESVMVGD